ncbi:GGDEF domain-containing protein [Paraburkholderia silviterrae]|uniref:diguanylate cyclase n=1 Tax=Paraburkholderia silviterrae TaxID=2528715 RepID=A0A4R5M7C7_9BURK|nr:GGDEF domain-containing protein [Paraburkholderia silviterrae]TDG22113.1 GGDEF domain-containing protein [Paraburkholderia silviterrae]
MLSPLALFGILIVSCTMSVAILGSLRRTAVPGVVRWCVAYALLAVASTAVLFAGDRPRPFAIVAISFITMVAVALLLQGTRQFFGIPPTRRAELAAFAAAFAAMVYFTCVSPSIEARVVCLSVVLAYGRIAAATLALRHARHAGARYAARFVAVSAWLGALSHLARAGAVVFGLVPPVAFVQPSPWNVVLLGLAIVSSPCMSIGMVMLAHDQLIRRMERLATIDELTGALMRRAFMEKAGVLLGEAREAGKALSIAILDIDNFKSINDSFGHAVGDRTLTHIGSVVLGQLRGCDLFGRLGGEEFAILFVDTRKSDAAALTNALRLALERVPDDGVRCTFSAGVERIALADTLEGAMARADAALYLAKAMGRNRVVTASEVDVHGIAAPR